MIGHEFGETKPRCVMLAIALFFAVTSTSAIAQNTWIGELPATVGPDAPLSTGIVVDSGSLISVRRPTRQTGRTPRLIRLQHVRSERLTSSANRATDTKRCSCSIRGRFHENGRRFHVIQRGSGSQLLKDR